ncbi:MAG: prepilin-type N-terminal cleavage/methylation domain-containing protein [Bacteroidetes bacterium]|nr:prepilin-type N-terminal cleavage/methylation domain-containing protein [Bacteroidota bacterium]
MMTSPWGSRAAGFSLVELLVVVSVIGLLAGLSAVTIPRAIDSGKKTKAKADLTAIVAAVKAYRQEYGKYPVAPSKMDQASDEFNSWYGPPTTPNDSKLLMRILSGDATVALEGMVINPKGVRFLEGAGSDGTFQDPWGNQYAVKMDTNESGGVEYYNPAGGNAENLRVSVIAVSLGKNKIQEDPDKKATKTCDDVFSWR